MGSGKGILGGNGNEGGDDVNDGARFGKFGDDFLHMQVLIHRFVAS